MPPQLPNNQQRNPRHRVVAVMTAAQEDAMAQLRRAGIPETHALLVIQRISSLCLQTLGNWIRCTGILRSWLPTTRTDLRRIRSGLIQKQAGCC